MIDAWKGYLVGMLANDDDVAERTGGRQAIFINSLQVIQFAVRPVSPVPASLPQVKVVYGFSNDLEPHGFLDDFALAAEERLQSLRTFLQGQLLVFQPVQKGQYFNISNLCLVAQPLAHTADSFYLPLPAFSQGSCRRPFEAFATQLAAAEAVGEVAHLSGDAADTPQCVVWRGSLSDPWLVLGTFHDHQYSQQGLELQPDGQLKMLGFQECWEKAVFAAPGQEQLLFVDQKVYQEMLEAVAGAEPLSLPLPGEQHAAGEEAAADTDEIGHQDTPMAPTAAEQLFLARLESIAGELGLLYSQADLVNLHTAMKSSRLVILAGLSGTGKSRLMQCYAQALGLPSEQTWMIPVRPSWTDDADLIGFLDPSQWLFRPGDSGLLQALLQAAAHPERLHLVCLDEMNLARVEHYFSQLLSVLELPPSRRILRLYPDQLAARLLNSHLYPPTVRLGDNLLFGGTVNLDESTYHFSDKVLDRANVIRLEMRPFKDLLSLPAWTAETPPPITPVSAAEYRDYIRLPEKLGLQERELSLLQNIHDLLQRASLQLGIGYRVVTQIGRYLANLPKNPYLCRSEALDKQLLQRVFTKIRGPESQLRSVIGSHQTHPESPGRGLLLDLLDRYHDLSQFRHCRQALQQKAKDLAEHGYTV